VSSELSNAVVALEICICSCIVYCDSWYWALLWKFVENMPIWLQSSKIPDFTWTSWRLHWRFYFI